MQPRKTNFSLFLAAGFAIFRVHESIHDNPQGLEAFSNQLSDDDASVLNLFAAGLTTVYFSILF
jgi:hypothetical protein